MTTAEPKRRPISAVRDAISMMRSLSDQLSSIDAEIKSCKEKIHSIMEETFAKSEKTDLLEKVHAANDELKELKQTRKGLYDRMEEIKSKLDGIKSDNQRGKGASTLRTVEEVEKRMNYLEMRLITERISPNDEKSIAAEMQTLRGRMNQLSDMESNIKKQKNLDEQLREIKGHIAELSKTIAEKNAVKDSLKNQIEEINKTHSEKPAPVQKLDSRIKELNLKRKELIKKKDETREDIQKAKEEQSKFEEEIAAQKELEEKKIEIRKVIEGMFAEKDALLASVSAKDPANLDPLIYSLKALREVKPFAVNVNVLDALLKVGAAIPSSPADVDKIIEDLTKMRTSGQSEFVKCTEKIMADVARLDEKIRAEEMKIAEMPPTDYELLRKAGYREFGRRMTNN